MALRSRRHTRDRRENERTQRKIEQATHRETQRSVGGGSDENWMLERDRLLALIRVRKEDALKRQQAKQAKQAEQERLERKAVEQLALEGQVLERQALEEGEALEREALKTKSLEERKALEEECLGNYSQRSERLQILAQEQERRLQRFQSLERLRHWQQWVRRYRDNLEAEGFTLSFGVWSRPINLVNINDTIRFKDATAERLSDIPTNFPTRLEDSAYVYVDWNRIKYEHLWCFQRAGNLQDLGFQQSFGWQYDPEDVYWRGFFSLERSELNTTVWTWHGADFDEYLDYTRPPEDLSTYQILDLAGFDKTLLDGPSKQHYRFDLDRLPSAQIPRERQSAERRDYSYYGNMTLPLAWRAPSVTSRSPPTQPLVFPRIRSWNDSENLVRFTCPLIVNIKKKASYSYITLRKPPELYVGNNLTSSLKREKKTLSYDYRHTKALLEQLERFWRLCLRGCSWLDHVLPYRWSRRAARYSSCDWLPPPRSSPQYTYEVSGLLNEQASIAFPDTGSDQNLLSHDYARRNNLAIVPNGNGTTHIKSADGRLIPTLGSTQVSWSFTDSPHKKHMLVFHVLEVCVHDVLLGHPFLLETNTTELNRVKRYNVNTTSADFAGAVYDIHAASGLRPGQCTIDGYLAGEEIKTLGDTGAQVNIMSLAYAQARNFKLDITGNRGTFRFIDGSEAPSIASVNAMWISSDKKQYNLKFEVLIGSSYDVILGQKHIYGTKALLGKTLDPSASPNSSHNTTPMTLDPLPVEPRPILQVPQNLERSSNIPPDVDTSKGSNVCAVGFKSPLAKVSQAATRLLSKTKKADNLRPHLSSQAQDEIDRRANEESRRFQAALHGSDSSPSPDRGQASRNSTDSTVLTSTSYGSASTTPSGISTTIEPEVAPPSDAIAIEDFTLDEYQVENTYVPYLSNLLLLNPITLCNYVWQSATGYMSSQ